MQGLKFLFFPEQCCKHLGWGGGSSISPRLWQGMPSPGPTALASAACLLVFEDIYNVKGLMCSVICSAGGTGTIALVHISPARGLPAYVQVLNAKSAFHASLLTAAHRASSAQKYPVILFLHPPVFPALLLPTIFSSMVRPGLVGSLSCKTFLLPLFAAGGFIFKKVFLISPCL